MPLEIINVNTGGSWSGGGIPGGGANPPPVSGQWWDPYSCKYYSSLTEANNAAYLLLQGVQNQFQSTVNQVKQTRAYFVYMLNTTTNQWYSRSVVLNPQLPGSANIGSGEPNFASSLAISSNPVGLYGPNAPGTLPCPNPPIQQNPSTPTGQVWSTAVCSWVDSSVLVNADLLDTLVVQAANRYFNLAEWQTITDNYYFYSQNSNTWYKANIEITRTNQVNQQTGKARYLIAILTVTVTSDPGGCKPPTSGGGSSLGTGFDNTGQTGLGSGLDTGPSGVGIGQGGLSGTLGSSGDIVIPTGDGFGTLGGGVSNSGLQTSNPDYDLCYPLLATSAQAYENCKCQQNQTYCPPSPAPPQDIYDLSLDPICPSPGYGGLLDPVQGDVVVKGGYAQFVSNVDPFSPTFQGLGPEGQSVFLARGWQVNNGPLVNTYSQWTNYPLKGVTYANVSVGGLLALEKDLGFNSASPGGFYHVFEPVNLSAQELDCIGPGPRPYLQRIGTLGTAGLISLSIDINTYSIPYFAGPTGTQFYIIVEDIPYAVIRKTKPVIVTPPTSGPGPSGPVAPSGPVSPGGPVIPQTGGPVVTTGGGTPPQVLSVGKLYSPLDPPLIEKVQETFGLWSDNIGNLTTMFTCSYHPSSSNSWTQSHYTIYHKQCSDKCTQPQFEITYGHDLGSGSVDLGGYDYLTPTNAVYSQYRLLCLNPDEKKFTFAGQPTDHVYVINIKQDRMGDRFDEGNWELNLHHISSSQIPLGDFYANEPGLDPQHRVLRLIDDSKVSSYSASFAGHYYRIVSGSLEQGVYNSSSPQVFGHVYPNLGIIVLDANKLDQSASFDTQQLTEYPSNNPARLVMSMQGAATRYDSSGDLMGFKARRVQDFYDRYYFITVKNDQFTHSNNPTYVTGSEGLIRPEFLQQQKVYITSIGFYDKSGNLVAVGKVSKPILKTRVEEALFTVKLRY